MLKDPKIRKVIEVSAELSSTCNLPGWRQHHCHQRLFKRQYRTVQRLKHSTSKDDSKQQRKEQEIKEAHRVCLDLAKGYLTRADQTRPQVTPHDPLSVVRLSVLNDCMQHARRVLRDERIPHDESKSTKRVKANLNSSIFANNTRMDAG